MKKLIMKIRRQLSDDLHDLLKINYFEEIPINEIAAILNKYGIVILQEDNTEFSGIFCGKEGQSILRLGWVSSAKEIDWGIVYDEILNTSLILTWYKMEFGKYEVVGYIG